MGWREGIGKCKSLAKEDWLLLYVQVHYMAVGERERTKYSISECSVSDERGRQGSAEGSGVTGASQAAPQTREGRSKAWRHGFRVDS